MHPPILQFPGNKKVVEVVPPAELHLNIGITNDIFFALNEKWGSNFVRITIKDISIILSKICTFLLGYSMGPGTQNQARTFWRPKV